MPPNQHIIGGCNQIISLRFGFPNSFPKLPSADRSLAFRMGGRRGVRQMISGETWTTVRRGSQKRWCVGGTFNLPHQEILWSCEWPAHRIHCSHLHAPSISILTFIAHNQMVQWDHYILSLDVVWAVDIDEYIKLLASLIIARLIRYSWRATRISTLLSMIGCSLYFLVLLKSSNWSVFDSCLWWISLCSRWCDTRHSWRTSVTSCSSVFRRKEKV